MAGTLACTVTTPESKVFEGESTLVVAPAEDGKLGILPRHAPLIAMLGYGELRVESHEGTRRFFVDGGFLQVLDGRVSVLAATAVPAGELDRDVETRNLEELSAARPPKRATFEEADRHSRAVAAAKARAKLAGA